MPKKSRPRTEPTPRGGLVPLLTAALWGSAIALVLAAALLLALTAFAVGRDDPDPLVAPIGYAVAGVVSLVAGWLAERRAGRGALLCGLLAAAVLALVSWGVSLFLPGTGEPNVALTLGFRAMLVALTVGGAYLGRRRPGGRRK